MRLCNNARVKRKILSRVECFLYSDPVNNGWHKPKNLTGLESASMLQPEYRVPIRKRTSMLHFLSFCVQKAKCLKQMLTSVGARDVQWSVKAHQLFEALITNCPRPMEPLDVVQQLIHQSIS